VPGPWLAALFAHAARAARRALVGAAACPPSLAEARRAYYLGHYAYALALFLQLAETHDAEAAESAAIMLLLGEPQYGGQIRRNVPRAKALLLQAAGAGRTGAGALLEQLEHTD
jgi:hypothetical protein